MRMRGEKLASAIVCMSTVCAVVAQVPESQPSTPRRMQVSEVVASSLVSEKTPLKYPDEARNAGVQGTVVLKLVVSETGEVKEVSVVSGDQLLAQAATAAVRQWKYRPYTVDGVPVEIETQLGINFHLKTPGHTAPPLGTFRNGVYSNEFFDFDYPLSRDWVRETEAMRRRLGSGGQPSGMYVLVAALHIPQQTASLEADSSFVLSAISSDGRSCEQYLKGLADSLGSQKVAKDHATIVQLSIEGRDFYRADFDFHESPSHRAFLCNQSKDYLLQWNIAGRSKEAVEGVVSTLHSIGTPQTSALAATSSQGSSDSAPGTQNTPQVVRVKVSQGVNQKMRIKDVAPVYPPDAKYAHIQGTVVMSVVISKNGDIIDVEVLTGPIELVVSAVNAVRQWKYRPYMLKGEPVEVQTQITVNYVLSGI
jgi:TonB family protein